MSLEPRQCQFLLSHNPYYSTPFTVLEEVAVTEWTRCVIGQLVSLFLHQNLRIESQHASASLL